LILFNSCKLAGIEKRHYRHGFFVQHHVEKQKPKEIQSSDNSIEEQKAEVVLAKAAVETEEQSSDLVSSTESHYKVNVNKLLCVRTTFVNEHIKQTKKKARHKKLVHKRNNTDTLIFELMLAIIALIWLAFSYGLHMLIPAMSLSVCLVVVGAIMLAGIILLFVEFKKDQRKPSN
jgi:hypothetical protein